MDNKLVFQNQKSEVVLLIMVIMLPFVESKSEVSTSLR